MCTVIIQIHQTQHAKSWLNQTQPPKYFYYIFSRCTLPQGNYIINQCTCLLCWHAPKEVYQESGVTGTVPDDVYQHAEAPEDVYHKSWLTGTVPGGAYQHAGEAPTHVHHPDKEASLDKPRIDIKSPNNSQSGKCKVNHKQDSLWFIQVTRWRRGSWPGDPTGWSSSPRSTPGRPV